MLTRNDTGEFLRAKGIVVSRHYWVFAPSQTKNHRTTEVKDPFYEDLHYEGYTELCALWLNCGHLINSFTMIQ